MICTHGKSELEHCGPCAVAWKQQFGTTPWETTARCPHVSEPNARGRREPMALTIVDGTQPERILKGTCERCGTATPAKRGKR